jgi:hypothetical protein
MLPDRSRTHLWNPLLHQVSLGKFSTVGSLMGGITHGSVMVEGYFAKVRYLSLYKILNGKTARMVY